MKLLSIVAAALITGASLHAASVPAMSFEHIVRSSPRAFRGVVTKSWSAWDEGRTAIWTHYEIRVAETLRGPAGATFTISEPGGTVDGLTMEVPGAPRFSVGEEAVVFAYQTPIGYWRVRGWGQGGFRVDRQDGHGVVRAQLAAGVLLIDPKGTTAKAAAQYPPGKEPLDAFLQRVRGILGEESAR